MPGKFHHEEIYRGAEAVAKLGLLRLTLCGAGALGSHLADNLARQGLSRLKVIDHDRVEEHNVGTQLYGQAEVGLWKVEALRSRLFRAASVEIQAVRKELTPQNARTQLGGCDLVLDTFDNSASRALIQMQCRESGIACLHVGLSADYGEVIWDECYRVPRDAGGDVCDYPLARNLILLTTAVASEALMTWVTCGERRSLSVTLGDLLVRAVEAP